MPVQILGSTSLFGAVFVPVGYVSGSSLSDTSTWDNTTVAALGLIPGTYTYTWGSGPTASSFAVKVSGTPELGTSLLVAIGSLGLILLHFGNLHKSRFHGPERLGRNW